MEKNLDHPEANWGWGSQSGWRHVFPVPGSGRLSHARAVRQRQGSTGLFK